MDQRLRTPTVLELRCLGLGDHTINGKILWSLRTGRRALVRESFRAELHAACMTAIISGPRYGSTSELQRTADAIPSYARRQYTRPVTLFLELEKKMRAHTRRNALDSAQLFSPWEYLSGLGVIQNEA
jgi:hypothetical protein